MDVKDVLERLESKLLQRKKVNAMLKQRIITALVLLPLVLAVIFMVPLNLFAGLVAIAVYLLALEWAKLAGLKDGLAHTIYALAVSAINFLIWWTSSDFMMWPSPSWPNELVWDSPMFVIGLSVVAIFFAVFIVLSYSRLPKWWANFSIIGIMGFVLLPAFFVAAVSIRSIGSLTESSHGGSLVLLMFCLVWAADTGAYIAGKAFGKTKLAPVISPNKTWEGVAGGLFLSVVVAWVGAYIIQIQIQNAMAYSLVVFILAIFSVLGDLFESAMKRVNNIKDSGNLLPGHGGVLDRLDSTIVVAPLYYLSFSFFGWF